MEGAAVRIAFWSKDAGAAEVRIKDAAGNVWKELPATAQPGLNVLEYDLSTDLTKTDAAEEAARKAALEKEKAKPAETGRRETPRTTPERRATPTSGPLATTRSPRVRPPPLQNRSTTS